MLETKEVLLRCTGCRDERSLALSRDQRRRLADGGKLPIRCGYCSSPQLWESAEEVELTSFITSPIASRRTIPVEQREVAAGMLKTGEPRKAILLVEDDELTVGLLRRVLEAWDARVEVAQNGKEALPKLAKERFDLLVCDIRMPEMNGQELFKYIQANAYLPPQRILFLTGDKSAAVKQFMDGTGCNYFYKPLEFLDFSGYVQTLLAGEDSRLTARNN